MRFQYSRTSSLPKLCPLSMPMKAPGRPARRDRMLSDDEVGAIWKAAGAELGVAGPFVRALLLTCSRLNELAGLRRRQHTRAQYRDLTFKHFVKPADTGRDTIAGVKQVVSMIEAVFAAVRADGVVDIRERRVAERDGRDGRSPRVWAAPIA